MTHPDQTVRVPLNPDAGLMSVISAMVRRIAVAVSVEDDEVYFDNGHARQIYKAITDAAPSPEAEGAGEREAAARAVYASRPARWLLPEVCVMTWDEAQTEASDRVATIYRDVDTVLASLQRPQTTAPDSGVVDRLVEAEHHLAGLCDAYRLICDDVGRRYYESPASKYAHAQAFLARKGAA